MNNTKIAEIIHEITSIGQVFKSYANLLSNPSVSISRKKEIEILDRCGKRCLELRNLWVEQIKEE
jgi:F0F1-type ATP synthase delta subunit